MDPIVSYVLKEFIPAISNYDRKSLKQFLQQQDAEDIQIMLENWNWLGYPTQRRMLQEELDHREPSAMDSIRYGDAAPIPSEEQLAEPIAEAHESDLRRFVRDHQNWIIGGSTIIMMIVLALAA